MKFGRIVENAQTDNSRIFEKFWFDGIFSGLRLWRHFLHTSAAALWMDTHSVCRMPIQCLPVHDQYNTTLYLYMLQ